MEVRRNLDLARSAALLVFLIVNSLGNLGFGGVPLGVLATVVDSQVQGSEGSNLRVSEPQRCLLTHSIESQVECEPLVPVRRLLSREDERREDGETLANRVHESKADGRGRVASGRVGCPREHERNIGEGAEDDEEGCKVPRRVVVRDADEDRKADRAEEHEDDNEGAARAHPVGEVRARDCAHERDRVRWDSEQLRARVGVPERLYDCGQESRDGAEAQVQAQVDQAVEVRRVGLEDTREGGFVECVLVRDTAVVQTALDEAALAFIDD